MKEYLKENRQEKKKDGQEKEVQLEGQQKGQPETHQKDFHHIIGLVENVVLKGKNSRHEVCAKIDTGAKLSAVDTALAASLELGPIVRTKTIKSSLGTSLRPVVLVRMVFAGQEVEAEFSVADRTHLQYPVLIGQNVLTRCGVLIDPLKKAECGHSPEEKQ